MDWISTIFAAVAILLLLKWLFFSSKQSNSPPGPTPLPLIGNIIYIARQDPVNFIALHKISKRFGDITKLRIAFKDTIVISSSKVAHELYSLPECLNRPNTGPMWDRMLQQNIGVGFSNGENWSEIRKFTSRSLRQFGFGNRNAMAKLIKEELVHLVKDIEIKLESSSDSVLHFNRHFQLSFLNLVASLIRGKRHDYEDPQLLKLIDASRKWFSAPLLGIMIVTSFPLLRFICPGILGHTTQLEASRDMQDYARGLLKQRRKELIDALELEKNATCFTDLFLKAQEEHKNNPDSLFTDDQFAVLCTDLIQGGADTSSNFLSYAIVLLTIHQDVQEKVVEEIGEVIGYERSPEPEDHQSMPYTQAVILEIFRHGRLFPIIPPREAICDFRFKDYVIKKGTLLIVNSHSCFMDEDKWENVHSFRPERFLKEDPSHEENVEKITSVLFGAGKRMCFGDQMGKDSSFLYLTTLLQKFSFGLPGKDYPTPEAEPVPGIASSPKPFYAKVQKRIKTVPK